MLKVESKHPYLVLVDVAMPLLKRLDAAQEIKGRMPDVKIIFVNLNHDIDLIAEGRRTPSATFVTRCF